MCCMTSSRNQDPPLIPCMARARNPLCSFCVCAPDPRAGKFMLCITFSGVFLYSSEVFPTAVRTQGMGLSSLAARFGAGLAPLVVVVLGEALASRCSRLMRCQAARAYVALATDTRAGACVQVLTAATHPCLSLGLCPSLRAFSASVFPKL